MSDAAKVSTVSSVTGLLLPLTDRTLLLPNVAVAELVSYENVHAVANSPDWFLGQIGWRDLRLPLLSFEAASGAALSTNKRSRVVIVNALGGRANINFIALLVQGIPRSFKADNELLFASEPLAPLELAAVDVAGQVAKIPDLVALEQMLEDAGML